MITGRPPEHSRVCWAAALGDAERIIGGYIDHADLNVEAEIVTGARKLLAADATPCICPRHKVRPTSSKRGRRYR